MKTLIFLIAFPLCLQLTAQSDLSPHANPTGSYKVPELNFKNISKDSSSANYVCYEDSALWHWYTSTLGDYVYYKVRCYYDAQQNNTDMFSFMYDTLSGTWKNYGKASLSYNSSGYLLARSDYDWDPVISGWQPTSSMSFTYNSSNVITGSTSQVRINGQLRNGSRMTYTIGPYQLPTNEKFQGWDTSALNWTDVTRLDRNFDAAGDYTLGITYKWSGTGWINYLKKEQSYDTNHNSALEINHVWSVTSNSWMPNDKLTRTYSSSGATLTTIYATWQTNAWKDYTRTTYTSLPSTTIIASSFYEMWNPSLNQWQNGYRDTLYFNNFNYNTREYEQIWDQSANAWKFYFDTWMYYTCRQSMVGIEAYENNQSVVLYPNPTHDYLNIRSALNTITKARIFSVNGQLLLETKQVQNIPVFNLKSGIYFVLLFDEKGGELGRKKFVKE